jgi:hypothetical protein
MEATAYKLIEPPFQSLKFEKMSKKELKDYARWFHEVLPRRVEVLAEAVRQSPGFEQWTPSLAPDSLASLGPWFKAQVNVRQRTPEELNALPAHIRDWAKDELTDRTISVAMDVGMYLSQVFLANKPTLQWDQIFGSNKFIDYGQPVLTGLGNNVPFNPVRMMITMAYGLADKTKGSNALRQLYDYWISK